jgi:hypothetical protein
MVPARQSRWGPYTSGPISCCVHPCVCVFVYNYRDQAVEIIVALKKLGEELTPEELHILETSDEAMKQFELADKAIGVCVFVCSLHVVDVSMLKSFITSTGRYQGVHVFEPLLAPSALECYTFSACCLAYCIRLSLIHVFLC